MPMMLLRAFLWLVLLAGIAGCQMQRPREISAIVLVSGPDVRVNGRPATDGMPLRRGDRVTTGASSSARIDFSNGTRIQLGPNTDPDFEWSNVTAGAKQAATVTIDFGLMLIETSADFGVRVFGNLADVFYGSEGVVQADRRLFRAYLFRGTLTPIRPQGRPLTPLEFFEVGPTGVRIGRIDPGQIRELRAMFDRYEFEPNIRMPSLRRMDMNEATQRLETLGLRVGQVEEEISNDLPNGVVLRQSIPPGTLVGRETTIDLVIARRVEPVQVRVPKVEGMRLEDAIAKLESRGLQIGKIAGPQSGDRIVVTQRPAAGTHVSEGDLIFLEVRGVQIEPVIQ